ncbi:MAG: NrfD/PsrC family molybdoenzyme membrane anchor subunit [Planctomycetota bacterium]|jgi:molybdopterin-containing oxidoreductase family membrane subunit
MTEVQAATDSDVVTALAGKTGPQLTPAMEKKLLGPLLTMGRGFKIAVTILLAISAFSVLAYLIQLRRGLGETGMNRPVYWGVYITNFVFFIGISHAGTLISAILRLCNAEWRRPITRSAEVITVMVLFFGVFNIMCDLGRPDRALNIITTPYFRSPLLWDVCSITAYLVSSSIYLYLPLIPDIAICRDRFPQMRWFYGPLALGWCGTERQKRILNRLIGIMALIVLPVAISVHTVVSWVFGMTIQPLWHSSIFGPYFVVGAIFSGIAALIIAMAIIRSAYRLQSFMKQVHFDYLGRLLLVMTLLWFYFTFAEHLTAFYGNEPAHMAVLEAKMFGRYWPLFWAMVLCCFVIPMCILTRGKTRTIKGTVTASAFITIGMWLERYTIVVPTLVNPRLPYERGIYAPTWIEWWITAGSFSMFILLYMLFTKLFPIISIWEIKEGMDEGHKETHERVLSYLPTDDAGAEPEKKPDARR